eukprot:TRINITY_DN6887_c0_g1_i3.p1 TRINITY_DN6887_c0_g1~~TRINITY_DN6887_c0_g1_i3.p1  ORF type:complete len:134 (+),score=23.50 TRINITY_DN6887_c0_g1_i3:83-484(+)
MIRRPPRSTLSSSSAASDVYKRQYQRRVREKRQAEMAKQMKSTSNRRVNQPWVGEGSTSESLSQGFDMFDKEQDSFGDTQRLEEHTRVASALSAIKTKISSAGCPWGTDSETAGVSVRSGATRLSVCAESSGF